MADIECPQCGRRVLAVATRCPHCGEGIPAHLLQHPGSGSRAPTTRLALLLGGAALVVGLVLLAGRSGEEPKMVAPPQAAAEDTVQPAPDTTSSSTPAAAAAPTAPPPAAHPTLRRYARTWVNVRSGRSGAAPGVRVLSPGDGVLVDSLRRGWYRVIVNGEPQGYVDRTFLDTIPPPGRP